MAAPFQTNCASMLARGAGQRIKEEGKKWDKKEYKPCSYSFERVRRWRSREHIGHLASHNGGCELDSQRINGNFPAWFSLSFLRVCLVRHFRCGKNVVDPVSDTFVLKSFCVYVQFMLLHISKSMSAESLPLARKLAIGRILQPKISFLTFPQMNVKTPVVDPFTGNITMRSMVSTRAVCECFVADVGSDRSSSLTISS